MSNDPKPENARERALRNYDAWYREHHGIEESPSPLEGIEIPKYEPVSDKLLAHLLKPENRPYSNGNQVIGKTIGWRGIFELAERRLADHKRKPSIGSEIPAKLRLLADWFDRVYPTLYTVENGRYRKLPSNGDEVQTYLREIADELEHRRGESPDAAR